MTVIDAWAALTEGYLPTNDQLAAFITKDSSLFKFPDLSPSGKRFGKDVSELRNLFIELLKNRNGKEEVQRFIWGLELAAARQGNLTQESSAAAGTAADAASKGDKASAKEKRWVRDAAAAKSSEAVRHLRTVARILLVQPQIRYILSDAATVLAQVVAATAEETIPIAQGQMEQVSSEAPVVEVVEGDASAGSAAAVNTALDPNTTPQNAKAQMGANGLPRITPELVDAVVRDPNLKLKVPLTSSTVVDAAQMAAVARTRLAAKDKVFTAGAAKKVGHDLVSNAENVWETDGKFRAIERLRKLCVDLQRSKGWREAATFFLSEGEHALEKASSGLQKTQDKAEHLESDTFVALLDLLENFGGQGSARGILETLQSFLHKARDDAAAQEFFKLLNTLSRRALLEEAYALSKEAEDDAKRLYATLGSLNQELRSELVTLLAQVVDFAGAIAQDEYLNAFVKKLNDILLCFAKTADGGWGLNTDLWRDVTLIIVPTLVSRLGVLPIPRIMYSHPDFDFVVENIALELNHLVPKYLDVSMTNDVHIDFERINSSAHSHMLKIKIRGMSLRVHRFAFAFTAKKGIKFHDHGIADLTVGGFGLSITIEIPRDRGEHYFFVRKCKAKLEELKFHIRKSNHRILHAMASGITNSYPTRKILSLIIGRGIGLGLKQLDLALMQAHLERERLRREGIQQKTEISVDELRSRVATIRDLMQKYHESAGTFRIDFDPSEDPKNEKGWEDAHAVKWIKETIEKTGAQDVKVHEWRSTAFGADDPFLAQHGEQKEDGHAARMAAKLQQLASKAATAAAKTDKKQDTNESQGVVPQSDAVDEAAIQKAENDLTALQNTADQEGEATHMESEAGKKAERRHSDVSDQVKELEKAVDKATS